MISMALVDENKQVLNISTNGYGKRSSIDEYRSQTRGGTGIKAMQLSERNGELAAQLLVSEDEDILVLSDSGILIRLEVANISVSGRATQGVRLMRLDDNAKVVSVAIAEKEPEEVEELEEVSLNEEEIEDAEESFDLPEEAESLDMDDTEEVAAEDEDI